MQTCITAHPTPPRPAQVWHHWVAGSREAKRVNPPATAHLLRDPSATATNAVRAPHDNLHGGGGPKWRAKSAGASTARAPVVVLTKGAHNVGRLGGPALLVRHRDVVVRTVHARPHQVRHTRVQSEEHRVVAALDDVAPGHKVPTGPSQVPPVLHAQGGPRNSLRDTGHHGLQHS